MKSCQATKILSPQGQINLPSWVKMDPHDVLVHHMVDVQEATADFREASERRPATSSQTNRVSKQISVIVHLCRSGSASTTGTQGPGAGKEDAFEKQIAGRWHVITLQEAAEYVDHDLLTSRFHVTHYAGCAILFNKDTFYTNIDVKSIYLHDTRRDLPDQVMEGDQGWVMQGVLSRASFRRPTSGQVTFTVLSLHINNIYAKKKGIAKKLILTIRAIMIGQQIDLVAGDFNGTAWRCSSRNNISTIDEAFTDCALPTPPGPAPLWDPDQFRTTGLTSVDFFKPPGIQIDIGRCACTVHSPSHEKLLACDQPIKVAIMRHGSTWISSTGATLGYPQGEHGRHIFPQRTSCVISSRATEKTHQ